MTTEEPKFTLTIGEQAVEVNFKMAAVIVEKLPDIAANKPLFRYLSQSSSSELLLELFDKENLDAETVKTLVALTKSGGYNRRLWQLLRHHPEAIPDDDILEIVQGTNTEFIADIAAKISECRKDEIFKVLMHHPDPNVRFELAGNNHAPAWVISRLGKDDDPAVRAEARSRFGWEDEA